MNNGLMKVLSKKLCSRRHIAEALLGLYRRRTQDLLFCWTVNQVSVLAAYALYQMGSSNLKAHFYSGP